MNRNHTKEIFISALERLLKTKHIDKIRVQEICEECGLNKKNFPYEELQKNLKFMRNGKRRFEIYGE